jgi:hypothetical protein
MRFNEPFPLQPEHLLENLSGDSEQSGKGHSPRVKTTVYKR